MMMNGGNQFFADAAFSSNSILFDNHTRHPLRSSDRNSLHSIPENAALEFTSGSAGPIAWVAILRNSVILVDIGEENEDAAQAASGLFRLNSANSGWDTYSVASDSSWKGIRFQASDAKAAATATTGGAAASAIVWSFLCVYNADQLSYRQAQTFVQDALVASTETFRAADTTWRTGSHHACQYLFSPVLQDRIEQAAAAAATEKSRAHKKPSNSTTCTHSNSTSLPKAALDQAVPGLEGTDRFDDDDSTEEDDMEDYYAAMSSPWKQFQTKSGAQEQPQGKQDSTEEDDTDNDGEDEENEHDDTILTDQHQNNSRSFDSVFLTNLIAKAMEVQEKDTEEFQIQNPFDAVEVREGSEPTTSVQESSAKITNPFEAVEAATVSTLHASSCGSPVQPQRPVGNTPIIRFAGEHVDASLKKNNPLVCDSLETKNPTDEAMQTTRTENGIPAVNGKDGILPNIVEAGKNTVPPPIVLAECQVSSSKQEESVQRSPSGLPAKVDEFPPSCTLPEAPLRDLATSTERRCFLCALLPSKQSALI